MSNTTYIYNIASPAAILASHVQGQLSAIDSVQVVEAPNRVPLPWLLAFSPKDFRPVEARYRIGPSEWASRKAVGAVASVNDALNSFLSRSSEIVELVSDKEIAQGFVQLMLDGLSSLPLPYIALDSFEVVDLNDADVPSRAVLLACGAADGSKEHRLSLSGFTFGIDPYPSDAIYSKSSADLPDEVRRENAVALDPLFLPNQQRIRRKMEAPGVLPSRLKHFLRRFGPGH